MVKCLIRIKTKVNVHLRMINHCYRDVKIRVLSLGPRLLGRALGALPLFPALTAAFPASMIPPTTAKEMGISGEAGGIPAPSTPATTVREIGITGLESLRDSAHSTPVRSSDNLDALSPCTSRETVISDEAYTPCSSILPTPVCESNLELSIGQQVNGTTCTTQDEESDMAAPNISDLEIPPPALPGPERASQQEPEPEQANKFLQSVLRLLAVTLCLLLALLLLLVILAESDLELAFLRDIRLTPEFQQFHYQYFCPLRRWVSCKLHPFIRLIDS